MSTELERLSPPATQHFLAIQPIALCSDSPDMLHLREDLIKSTLMKIMSERMDITEIANCSDEELKSRLQAFMPIVATTKCRNVPGTMSIFAFSHYRPDSFKFFYEMVTGWLVPGKRIQVVLVNATNFRIPSFGQQHYTLSEVMIHLDSQEEYESLLLNLPVIETELQMGLSSTHYARRILEIRGFSKDEFTASIQENIAFLIDHSPDVFDLDVLTEMQHVLLICRDDFKLSRETRHISRIIAIQYLFRKELLELSKESPDKRHIKLKLIRTRLKQGDKRKHVLGILVGVNFFKDKEFFDKVHLLKAIQTYLPNAMPIPNSFFSNRRGTEPISTLYLEIEKGDGEPFTSKEIMTLRTQLPINLKDRIKHLLNPVFMPRNEEEIIRNILSLSNQIKYLRDIPQVFITFDEQTATCLLFTIILVRVLKPGSPSVQEMFKRSETILQYTHDRCQHVGSLRRKYKKEATVFRVKLSKEQFIRADHTIDLNRARQVVVSELYDVMGDIRDYNGGMISKQNEVLDELKVSLQESVKFNELLLENFFYSITPVIMRSVLELEPLRSLFLMLIEAIEDGFFVGEHYALKISFDAQFVYVMIKTDDKAVKEELQKAIGKLQVHSSQLAYSLVSVYDEFYLGYIYRSDDIDNQQRFSHAVQHTLALWETKKKATMKAKQTLFSA